MQYDSSFRRGRFVSFFLEFGMRGRIILDGAFRNLLEFHWIEAAPVCGNDVEGDTVAVNRGAEGRKVATLVRALTIAESVVLATQRENRVDEAAGEVTPFTT